MAVNSRMSALQSLSLKNIPDVIIYSTIGLSAQNMPTVDLFHKDYLDYARIELVIAVRKLPGDKSESWVPHFWRACKFPGIW